MDEYKMIRKIFCVAPVALGVALDTYFYAFRFNVSAATAERYIKHGPPEAQYRLIQLSLGDL